MTIFLDMDCTIADFVTGACAAHGLHPRQAYPHWPAGEYGMTRPVGLALGYGAPDADPLDRFTDDAFWAPINGDDRFWCDLPRLPWAAELVDLVRSLTDDWYVVTAPSRCVGCVPGKQAWLSSLLGVRHTDRLIPTQHKHLLAGPGRVLVDDSDANCRAFLKCPRTGRPTGGHAVSFPCHHNHQHVLKDDPMPFVRAELESWRLWGDFHTTGHAEV